MTEILGVSENFKNWYERMGVGAGLRPFPTTQQEAWRVSNLKALREVSLGGLAPYRLELFELDESGNAFALPQTPEGLKVTMGREAFSGKSISSDEFYEDVSKLFPEQSVRIEVSKNFNPDKTLLFQWVSEPQGESYPLAPLNVFWDIQSGAEIHLAKSVLTRAEVMSVWREEFQIGAGGRVEVASVANTNEGIHLESRSVYLQRDASWSSLVMDIGGKYSRYALNCHLEGENSSCRVFGALGLSGTQASEHPTVLDHIAPHSTSEQLYKSVMNGTSRAVVNGRVVIRQDAQKVDSSQYNKNLLLSQGAYVHSKPELRVAADDVQAAHGATTGQLDEEELFYLRARGLSEGRARELISAGFLLEVLESLSRPDLRRWAQGALTQTLPQILGESH